MVQDFERLPVCALSCSVEASKQHPDGGDDRAELEEWQMNVEVGSLTQRSRPFAACMTDGCWSKQQKLSCILLLLLHSRCTGEVAGQTRWE